MRQGCLGSKWRYGAILLAIFDPVGIGLGEVRNFDLVGVGEEHRWSDDGFLL